MKKFILLFFINFCLVKCITAQLKVGDNVTIINANSLLELESTNKGLVIPRVALSDVALPTPLTSTILKGTLVYSTSSPAGGIGQGLYIWNGSLWQSLGTLSSISATAPVVVSNATTAPIVSLQGTGGGVAYGTGTGSSFTNAGTAGQVLVSNGSSAPVWNGLWQSVSTVYTTHTTSISTSSYTVINDLTQTINVPANSTVVLSTSGGMIASGVISTSILGILNASVQLAFFDNGVQIGSSEVITTVGAINISIILTLGSNAPAFWSMNQSFPLSAGSHIITVRAKLSSYNSAGYSALLASTTDNGSQGSLTSVILNTASSVALPALQKPIKTFEINAKP